MTRSLEQVAGIWAARRLKLTDTPRIVGEVGFNLRAGCYHTDEEAVLTARVEVLGYSQVPKVRHREIEIQEWDLAVFLEELVAIAQEEADDAQEQTAEPLSRGAEAGAAHSGGRAGHAVRPSPEVGT